MQEDTNSYKTTETTQIQQKAQQSNIQRKIQNMQINTYPFKKLYSIQTALGNLTIQILKFQFYLIVVVCYSTLLKIDGYLQVAFTTPYNQNPTVLNLAKDQGQLDSQKICQSLGRQTKCPVLLSLNVQVANKKDQQELIKVLCQILAQTK